MQNPGWADHTVPLKGIPGVRIRKQWLVNLPDSHAGKSCFPKNAAQSVRHKICSRFERHFCGHSGHYSVSIAQVFARHPTTPEAMPNALKEHHIRQAIALGDGSVRPARVTFIRTPLFLY